jgi:hypothetical protein
MDDGDDVAITDDEAAGAAAVAWDAVEALVGPAGVA